ncbi:hypothetical protein [Bradyrhizobium niftali]|uniref:hypothetical protein n=1 Tax=Bradyrhizobium niftali TaxID=2560055 RepID=UPI001F3B1CDF|nr:hypothetical protein [Bradyrhizobium niftali]
MTKRPLQAHGPRKRAGPATEIDAQSYSAFVGDLKTKIAEASIVLVYQRITK